MEISIWSPTYSKNSCTFPCTSTVPQSWLTQLRRFKKSFIWIQTQVELALTDSLPLSCMPFARRDSVFDLLSISSMIPWMWSPEIPWKSMAPGPGRNVQLPASVLQPTTSIYRIAALRPALSAHPNGLWGSERGTQNNTTPKIQITSSPECKGNWKKRRKKKNEETTTWVGQEEWW